MLNKHKICRTEPNYEAHVHAPPVVPMCYTKMSDGCRIMIEGAELDAAKSNYGQELDVQTDTLNSIKDLKLKMEDLRGATSQTDDAEQFEKQREDFEEMKTKYFKLKYPDNRNYSDDGEMWREAFLSLIHI